LAFWWIILLAWQKVFARFHPSKLGAHLRDGAKLLKTHVGERLLQQCADPDRHLVLHPAPPVSKSSNPAEYAMIVAYSWIVDSDLWADGENCLLVDNPYAFAERLCSIASSKLTADLRARRSW
jgi:hypothetical protein